MEGRRVRIIVSGKVQGVFFRQATRVEARKGGVRGWVRNLEDGRVEAVLEGAPGDVEKLIEWAHRGPASSRVENVDASEEEYAGEFSGFEVRY